MFINDFHARFISKREKGRLFDVLRRVSRLEAKALLADDSVTRWPEWPPIGGEPEPCRRWTDRGSRVHGPGSVGRLDQRGSSLL